MSSIRVNTVLIAEDDPDDRILIRDALEDSRLLSDQYFVEDGEELMEFLHQEGRYREGSPRPEVILLDLNMPRMDGREALQAIKKDPRLRRIPVIVFTTSKAQEDISHSYDLGANSFITKPASYEGMIEVLRTLGRYWFEVVTLSEDER